jgi:hypothetical protein
MNKTNIEELIEKKDDTIIVFDESLPSSEIRKNSIDLFTPLPIRIMYLELYYQKEPEQFGEMISCINGMYAFSRTIMLKEYLIEIAKNEKIPIIYRIDCSKNLNKEGYPFINQLCKHHLFIFLPTPIRVETILYLMKNDTDEYKEESRQYFCEIVNDIHIESLYRFKLIQRLENHFKNELFYYYANESSRSFVDSKFNHISYRVICCQYILQKCEEYLHIFANDFLLHVASQPNIDEDIRADACDILLAYGTPENVENARLILFVLGGGERARNNIFKNSQNVHNQSVEESVEKLIEFISTFVPKSGNSYTFDKAKEEIEEQIVLETNKDKHEILKQAIIRITIDRAIYGRLHLTLANIITKMWTYIQDSEHKEELQKRLLEELIDSHNKCSSGYVSRIVNTISGFGEMSLQISFEDQIITVLETRLNAKIMDEDEKDSDLILEEMTLPVRFFDKRGNFLKFFRTHISKIREDMYLEFKDYITDQDYDLFFRKAIMHYEGVI